MEAKAARKSLFTVGAGDKHMVPVSGTTQR